MQISACNILAGKVRKLTAGLINAETVVELPGGPQIASMIITRASADALALKKGREARGVTKSSDVMVGVSCGDKGRQYRK